MNRIPLHTITPSTSPDSGLSGRKIHVRLTEGKYQTLRRLISWPMILAFFLLVWIEVDGQPWLMFDFQQRRILLFGSHFSWHDLHILTGLMIAGACLLFFLAVAWGRVWCGFACPQSIWTWMFIRIENWTEGRASHRARQAHLPLRGTRLLRRLLKHLLWILLSCATAITFTGYFLPIRDMAQQLLAFDTSWMLAGWLLSMSVLTYLNAGLVREMICLHACPYSRFQAVMMDESTRKVSYDDTRGEPRAERKTVISTSQPASQAKGDCIDCGICIQVCPVGIDIREGIQAACIDCGACIDACDQVMDKIDRPRGLIRFASEKQLQRVPDKLLRPRLMGYLLVTLLAFSAAAYGVISKRDLVAEIQRDRGALYQVMPDGQTCNFYQVRVESFNPVLQQVRVTLPDETLKLYGPDELILDHKGHWSAYRICAEEPNAGVTRFSLHFTSGSAEVIKQNSFIAKP